jgi:hypothetical protein
METTMKKSPNRSAVFLMQPGNMRIAVNRAARREQAALSRKTYDGETLAQMKIRRAVAAEWRSTRRSREQGLMRQRG